MKSKDDLELKPSQVATFMENLELYPGGEATLDKLIVVQRFLEHVPFQNLTMLIGPRKPQLGRKFVKKCFVGMRTLYYTQPFPEMLLAQQGLKPPLYLPLWKNQIVISIYSLGWTMPITGLMWAMATRMWSLIWVSKSRLTSFLTIGIEKDGVWWVEHRSNDDSWRSNQSFIKRQCHTNILTNA